ncbi:hypothetical protein RRG08_022710 [Elysia crispata]|uniref:Secreted protein n=1 Tax=Elysia crispata TaxID=231223 RepID=A0AAE0ZEY2_9GAST|nr:hypothetical protein RRG08_022710 [Elysia crispata]
MLYINVIHFCFMWYWMAENRTVLMCCNTYHSGDLTNGQRGVQEERRELAQPNIYRKKITIFQWWGRKRELLSGYSLIKTNGSEPFKPNMCTR